MALIDIIRKNTESTQPPPPEPTPTDVNKLSVPELQFLLTLLKESSIKGEQIEFFYNLVIKLQNQYLEQSNKQ